VGALEGACVGTFVAVGVGAEHPNRATLRTIKTPSIEYDLLFIFMPPYGKYVK